MPICWNRPAQNEDEHFPSIPFYCVKDELPGMGDRVLPQDINAVTRRFLPLTKNREQHQFINPTLHAIGCSKRSCLCCTLWVNSFNMISTGITSASHGKSYDNWAIPGVSGVMAGYPRVDRRATNGVSMRRVSEEDASSGS